MLADCTRADNEMMLILSLLNQQRASGHSDCTPSLQLFSRLRGSFSLYAPREAQLKYQKVDVTTASQNEAALARSVLIMPLNTLVLHLYLCAIAHTHTLLSVCACEREREAREKNQLSSGALCRVCVCVCVMASRD
jgi:hypothetical protein